MKILAIGDIVGDPGCNFLREKLFSFKEKHQIDFVIANGENSANGNGITPASANFIFDSGVDVITTGNHAFRRREIIEMFKKEKNLIRPVNYPKYTTPGTGICIREVKGIRICVINLMGVVFLENLACPYNTMDYVLRNIPASDIIIIDFHAEATAEKRSLAFYLDGKVSAIFGTHTHVPTADECILPHGTGYITDVGMTGVINSSLGVKPELTIRKARTKMPVKFEFATGKCRLDCVIFDINESTFKTEKVERFSIF